MTIHCGQKEPDVEKKPTFHVIQGFCIFLSGTQTNLFETMLGIIGFMTKELRYNTWTKHPIHVNQYFALNIFV